MLSHITVLLHKILISMVQITRTSITDSSKSNH